ncbi:STAS domain-containing protein [Streptomyces xiangluensis]|uniref:STAS domain-containing protein n=1 Tax=Streptomyces xiangluensis TaxID=2665720 RepID=A0ABV8Z6H9_9ACTN
MVVAVSGGVDHLTAARLDDVLLTAVASGARSVEVDFSRVSFCDCAGLTSCWEPGATARTRGCGLW